MGVRNVGGGVNIGSSANCSAVLPESPENPQIMMVA